jgi:uncharacterized protein YjbK
MTSATREIEFKFAVKSRQAFADLLDHLELPSSLLDKGITQINHFFDSTNCCLHQRHFVIRLREENNRYLLTIKGEQDSDAVADSILTSRIEEEAILTAASAQALLDGSASPRQVIRDSFTNRAAALLDMIDSACYQQKLVHIGEFRNVRIHLPPVSLPVANAGEKLEFELDTSTFPDGSNEYEIEIEISEHSDAASIEAALKALFQQANIDWHSAPSKAERFFAALHSA